MIPAHQIILFTYHKTGTTVFENIFTRLGKTHAMPMHKLYGLAPFAPRDPSILMLIHALLGRLPHHDFRAIRAVRDPRDIWLSGYLYHRHCTEPWCINTDVSDAPPITFPRVPAAFHHQRERWKRDYLRGLGGRSYQQNLLDRDRDAGLAFELDRYTGYTIGSMRAWSHDDPRILDIRMEDLAVDFDGTMRRVFLHLGFPEIALPDLLALAAPDDVARMTDATLLPPTPTSTAATRRNGAPV